MRWLGHWAAPRPLWPFGHVFFRGAHGQREGQGRKDGHGRHGRREIPALPSTIVTYSSCYSRAVIQALKE